MSKKHYKPSGEEEYMTPKMVSYFETLLIGEQSLLEDNIRKQTSKQLAQCKKAIQAVSK